MPSAIGWGWDAWSAPAACVPVATGAIDTIDPECENVGALVLELAGGRGVDFAFEPSEVEELVTCRYRLEDINEAIEDLGHARNARGVVLPDSGRERDTPARFGAGQKCDPHANTAVGDVTAVSTGPPTVAGKKVEEPVPGILQSAPEGGGASPADRPNRVAWCADFEAKRNEAWPEIAD